MIVQQQWLRCVFRNYIVSFVRLNVHLAIYWTITLGPVSNIKLSLAAISGYLVCDVAVRVCVCWLGI